MVHLYSLNVSPPKAQPSDIAPLDEEFHFLDLRSQRPIRAKFWTFCGPILDFFWAFSHYLWGKKGQNRAFSLHSFRF